MGVVPKLTQLVLRSDFEFVARSEYHDSRSGQSDKKRYDCHGQDQRSSMPAQSPRHNLAPERLGSVGPRPVSSPPVEIFGEFPPAPITPGGVPIEAAREDSAPAWRDRAPAALFRVAGRS